MLFKRALLYAVLMSVCALAGAPVVAREGVEVGKESAFANLVPAAEVENSARQQYAQMLKEAASKNALGPDDHPQVLRLRRISDRKSTRLNSSHSQQSRMPSSA